MHLLSALTFTWSPVFRVTLKFATVDVHRLFTLAGMKAEADDSVSMTKAANDLTIVLSWAYAGVGSELQALIERLLMRISAKKSGSSSRAGNYF